MKKSDYINNYIDKIDEFISYKMKLSKAQKTYNKEEKSYSNMINIMNDMYSYTKNNVSFFYNDGEFLDIYKKYFINSILSCEMKLRNIKIIGYIPNFNYKKNVYLKSGITDENILKYIVYTERKRLVEEACYKELINIDLTGMCLDSSYNVKKHCDELGVRCERVRINPCFYDNDNILVNGYHYFNIATLHNKMYLIDCTYSQFFNYDSNIINRLGVPLLNGCYVGYYMIVDEKRKRVALRILEDGYIEFNEENSKYYLDGFAISYRNGLYYEELGRVEYNTSYNYKDYQRFIYTSDSQYDYENRNSLSYQKIPLKNPNIKF